MSNMFSTARDLLHSVSTLPWASSQQHDRHETETPSESAAAAAQRLSPSHMRPTLSVERDEDLRQGPSRRAESGTNIKRLNGSAVGKGASGRSADERRLMGDYRAPPDAVAIKMPGNDEPSYSPTGKPWVTGISGGRHDRGYDSRAYVDDRRGSQRSGYSSTCQGKGRISRQIPSTRPVGKHTHFHSSSPERSPKRQRVSSPAGTRQEKGPKFVDLVDDDDDMLMRPAESPRVERTTRIASGEPRSPARLQLTTLDTTASPPHFSRQIPTSPRPISAYEKLNGRRALPDNKMISQEISRGSPEVVVSSTQQPRRNESSMSPPGMSVSRHGSHTRRSKHKLGALNRLSRELPGSSPDQLQSEDKTESHYFAEAPRPAQAVKKRTAGEMQPKSVLKKLRLPDLEITRLIESTKPQSKETRKRSEAHERVQQQEDDVDTSLDELQNDQVTVHTTVTRLAGMGTKRATVALAAPPSDLPVCEEAMISLIPETTASKTPKREASPGTTKKSAKKVKRKEAGAVAMPLRFIHIYSEEREEDNIKIKFDPLDHTLKVYRNGTDHFYTINPKKLMKVLYSRQEGAQGPIVQVTGPGSGSEQMGCFLGFPADEVLDGFLAPVLQLATDVVPLEKSATLMLKFMHKKFENDANFMRNAERYNSDDQELSLLEQNPTRRAHRDQEAQEANGQSTSAARHKPLLTSRLQATKKTDPEGMSEQSTRGSREQLLRHRSEMLNSASNLAQRATTRLSSTRQKVRTKSPTPPRSPGMTDAQFQESLGPPWKDPVVYPPTGRNRATVNFSDLYRLRDDEFLNDAIIDFYIGYAAQKAQLPPNRVYFFNTFFYSQLATPASRGQRIDYKKVEKWTAKVDIFSYDYVVVPVNEDMHWYLAVICNLPNMKRTIDVGGVDEDTSKVGDGVPKAKTASLEPEPDAPADKPVEVSDDLGKEPPADGSANEGKSEEEPALTSSYARMNLGYIGPSVDAQRMPQSSQVAPSPEGASAQKRQVTPSTSTALGQRDSPTQSPARKLSQATGSPSAAKNRRRSGPPPKRYDTQKPVIIIMDSLGATHAKTAKNLKLYLVEEGLSKRGLSINPDEIPSMYAKDIPTQTNWSDCGLYLLAYVSKLVHDPTGFITKILTRDMDVKADWPDMNARQMRVDIIDLLRKIHDEQAAVKRQQKLAKKLLQAAAAQQQAEDGEKAKSPASASKSPEQDTVPEAKATDDSAAMPPPALPAMQTTDALKPSASNLSLVELDGTTMKPILPPSKPARYSLDLTDASDMEDTNIDGSNVMDALDNAISADAKKDGIKQKRPPPMLPSPYGSFPGKSFATSGLPVIADDVDAVEEVRPPTRGKE